MVIGGQTITVDLLICMFLPNSPIKAKRFNDAERMAVLMRVKDHER